MVSKSQRNFLFYPNEVSWINTLIIRRTASFKKYRKVNIERDPRFLRLWLLSYPMSCIYPKIFWSPSPSEYSNRRSVVYSAGKISNIATSIITEIRSREFAGMMILSIGR